MSTEGGVDKGVRILSLDGGGPGTYSQLLIIKEYMARLANDLGVNEGDVYPADYFDLMGGVGFGGHVVSFIETLSHHPHRLVAILLGHLRMNVDEAIEALLEVALNVFPGDPPNSHPEARTRQLRESVERIIQSRGVPLDRKMQEKREGSVGCKVALHAATTADLSHPVVLRTYKPRGSSLNPTIVEAICATVATQSYFTPIKVGPRGRQQAFIGGPRGASNPTRELLREASAVFGKEKLVAQIISLGCGRSHLSSAEGSTGIEGTSRPVHELAADCEIVAKELSIRLCEMDAYLRLDVERGMDNLVMNEWDDLGPIETHTSAYVEMAEISETIEASLRSLQGSTGTVTLGEINHPRAAKEVKDRFNEHKEDLDRAFKSMKDNEDSRILDRLKPVDAPSYYEGRSCMKETRTTILDHIITWAMPLENNTPSTLSAPNNIFWLYGSPGLGKTAIANSLCHRLHERGILGGSFFCRRDDPVLSDPNRVLSTLLYRLAWMSSSYRYLVVQALSGDPNLNPDWTGCALLLGHLYSLQNHPPTALVLVIDALDESGDSRTRAPLLKCISDICARVDWLKIVVISRPEHDIDSFFQRLGHVGHDLSKDKQADQDIRIFVKYRMASLAEQYYLPSDWPGESRLEQIARRSGGLFIFVETLYQFLDDPDPEPLLTEVLGGTLGEANPELHRLYSTAIETRIGRNKKDFGLFVQALVAVAAHRPLADEPLASLIGLEPRVVSSWVDKLSSLLYRDVSGYGAIRARHLSIIEFLTGPTCPSEFRVDVQRANGQIGHRCLITMTKELKFNICELETSCVSNANIQDLDDRVREKISNALQYSSMHWSSHLCSDLSPASKKISELLNAFLTGTQMLYWLEVLSLMGEVLAAISALRLIKSCIKKFKDCHQRLVEDALYFVLAFFTPISTSTPHIYISGLPFMPMESRLWKCASLSFPELMHVCKGRMKSWPAPSGVWRGHTSGVCSVAYSPDGQTVVSGSKDTTVRLWDAQTGSAVGEPLNGHTGMVWSVAYAPNGRNVVSGSWDLTLRIWDTQTGAVVGEPLKGHTRPVWSVAYSPDGQNIVSGSLDETIRIWDVATGTATGQPLNGHTGSVYCVAYSPDGRNIISSSRDKTIRIWDAQTGAAVREPLRGHTHWVISVAYSPDGRNIVSGSWDKTIRIWDAQIGVAVGKLQTGHTRPMCCVAYSQDGRNIVSGSEDNTVRIWAADTQEAVVGPLTAHSGSVSSVAYSPDGRNFISGSSDNTIRIWDAQTGEAVGEPSKVQSGSVSCIAYSPDGRNIISGSDDNAIRMWDAQTGEAVVEPLEGHTRPVLSVAYSPDGQNFVSGSSDKTIRIWDARMGGMIREPLRGHTGSVACVAYSPDGQNVVSGSWDNSLLIWDVQTGATIGGPLIGHTKSVTCVAYSPNGQKIISGSEDRSIRIWDPRTGAAVGGPLWRNTGCVYSIACSPDSRNIVCGSENKTIRILEIETGVMVREPLQGHSALVYSVAYSPDGRNIISGSLDDNVRIWDAETGSAVGEPLKGHTRPVRSIAYSPDGQRIISGSDDNTIRVWEAEEGCRARSKPNNISDDYPPLNTLSDLPISTKMLSSSGWVSGTEGLLFWVPDDCRHGLTCPAITTIPNTGWQRCVRIDFTRFQYGTSWTKIRGSNAEGEL